jgi:protein TonB
VIVGAIFATLGATDADHHVVVDTNLVYLNQPQEQQPEQPKVVQLDIPLRGFQTVIAPTSIPTDIPPIDLQEKFDPRDYSGSGVEGGTGTGMVPTGQIYAEAVVEEKPELLSGPAPAYPRLLKEAGIEGTVLIEVVIDTLGRAEANSIRIVQSPNPGFDEPVRDAVRRALFRPARVHGRAVRVLVRIPYKFNLTR